MLSDTVGRTFPFPRPSRMEVGDLRCGDCLPERRDEAFCACGLAMEAVNHTATIRKREHVEDRDSEWSEGWSPCGHAD